ncbi:MAG: hypothetical protein K6T83_15070 [Alicyclobacillus sp.]|nr:hypothetical protein [Alicyclobacillus sp.]
MDWNEEQIIDRLRTARALSPERNPELFVIENHVAINGELVDVEAFYQHLERRFLELIVRARELRELKVWRTKEVFQEMVSLDGGCMYLLSVLRGDSDHGEVFDPEIMETELKKVLSDPQNALDFYMAYDDCASPLGMHEWYGFTSTAPMI